jgi:hypothetical protein
MQAVNSAESRFRVSRLPADNARGSQSARRFSSDVSVTGFREYASSALSTSYMKERATISPSMENRPFTNATTR